MHTFKVCLAAQVGIQYLLWRPWVIICLPRQSLTATDMPEAGQMNVRDKEAHAHAFRSQDRNETLFYRLLIDDFTHMAPIVYTPTVGWASVNFHHVRERQAQQLHPATLSQPRQSHRGQGSVSPDGSSRRQLSVLVTAMLQ